MDGRENLRPPTTDEARERGRAGGIASGKSRRRKRAMKQMAREMLAASVDADNAERLAEEFGVEPDDADYQTAILAALVRRAVAGNVNAIQLIATLTGDDLYLQARQAEVRIKRAELKERIREYDLDRQDRQTDTADDDLATEWLDAVIGTGDTAQ